MNDYTNLDESDTSKILEGIIDSVQNKVNFLNFETYRGEWDNNWFNENNDYGIKTMYYKKMYWKSDENRVKKPTKLKDMISPGINFEEDAI